MNLRDLIQPVHDVQSISYWGLVGVLIVYLLVRFILLQGGLFLALQKWGWGRKRRVFQISFSEGQLQSEIKSSLEIILFDAILISALIKLSPSQVANGSVLWPFAMSFVWFEIWFYASHRILHTRALYWIHKQHHVAKVTSPFTALSFSLIERSILIIGGVGILFFFSAVFSIPRVGIALYLFINYFLNIYGHLNIEIIPPRWLRFPGMKALNTTTYHALHHARYKGHYGLFTPYLDKILKTDFEDYQAVQEKAYRGEGLKTFHLPH